MLPKQLTLLTSLALTLCVVSSTAEAQKIYWTSGSDSQSKIQRATLDGASVEELVANPLRLPSDIVFDPISEKIYWIERDSGKIQRANLDGSNRETVVEDFGNPLGGIAMNVSARKLYWVVGDVILQADPDGSNVDLLFFIPGASDSSASGITVDQNTGDVYGAVIKVGGGFIYRNNTLLFRDTDLARGDPSPVIRISLDTDVDKLYWTNSSLNTIQRANLDGTDVEEVYRVFFDKFGSHICQIEGIALDLHTENLYWTETCGLNWADAHVLRASLDFLTSEVLVTVDDPESGGAGGIALDATQGRIYWTVGNKIQSANLDDGSDIKDLFPSVIRSPRGMALDLPGGKMYWIDDDKIQRANLNGSEIENLVTLGQGSPIRIALDLAGGKMYWTLTGGAFFSSSFDSKIQRADLDGLNVEDVLTNVMDRVRGIALDKGAEKIYWVDIGTHKIQRANWDGSSVEDIIIGLQDPYRIALDVLAGKMYWADGGTDTIRRANLDGSNAEDVITNGLDGPRGIVLDLLAGKMYWTDHGGTDTIRRANLDGSNIEDLVVTNTSVIALDLTNGQMYWGASAKIHRANLDGSNIEDLLTTGPGGAGGIAVDPSANKIYWTEPNHCRIRRANLDGSALDTIVTTVSPTTACISPQGIVLDLTAAKIWWSDLDTHSIHRANLDGSNVENVVGAGLLHPHGIALDLLTSSKMYWTDVSSSPPIKRANLDGSNIEELITAGSRGIALDPLAGKIYWADGGADTIHRANLDGSNVEDVIATGLEKPNEIALDLLSFKIYWGGIDQLGVHANPSTYRIQRANLDGSAVEDFLRRLNDDPGGIALDLRVSGDCDENRAVTLTDHRSFLDCMTGPGVSFAEGCSCSDINGDHDIDLTDFATIQATFTTP